MNQDEIDNIVKSEIKKVLLLIVVGGAALWIGFPLGRQSGIAETRAKIIASEIENYAAWEILDAKVSVLERVIDEDAPWDKSTYDKAVAEEVERQKEMPRGR